MKSRSKMGSSECNQGRKAFLAACEDEKEALLFILKEVEVLRTAFETLQTRYKHLSESNRIPEIREPMPVFPMEVRDTELNGLTIERLKGKEILSLDIFDTCLTRTVSDPRFVFEWVGLRLEAMGLEVGNAFRREREAMENSLRAEALKNGSKEDILLEDIYQAMAVRFGWKPTAISMAMAVEVACEAALLRPVAEILHFACEAQSVGLPIHYTSEMYLRGEDVSCFLRASGFPVSRGKVTTSGETGKSKGTGNLYHYLSTFAEPWKILHVGDNPSTDFSIPQKIGLDCVQIQSARRAFPSLFPAVLESVTHKAPDREKDYWRAFGYKVAGPVHFAFATWLYRQCQESGMKNVYFLSRDGWFPKKVFSQLQEAWGSVANANYLYASREMLGIASMDTIDASDWEFILKPAPALRTRDFFDRLQIPEELYLRNLANSGLPGPDELICHHWGFIRETYKSELYHVICRCLSPFLEYKEVVGRTLMEYYSHSGLFAADSLFVDLGWSGSSFHSIHRMAKERPCPQGAYFALLERPPPNVKEYFTSGDSSTQALELLRPGVALMELIFGSPEPTVSRMRKVDKGWQPVFGDFKRLPCSDLWQRIGEGIEEYVCTVLGILPRDPGGDAHTLLEDILKQLIYSPDRLDLDYLGKVPHDEGWGVGRAFRMLPKANVLTDPDALLEAFCYCPWKPGLAKLLKENLNPLESTH